MSYLNRINQGDSWKEVVYKLDLEDKWYIYDLQYEIMYNIHLSIYIHISLYIYTYIDI